MPSKQYQCWKGFHSIWLSGLTGPASELIANVQNERIGDHRCFDPLNQWLSEEDLCQRPWIALTLALPVLHF